MTINHQADSEALARRILEGTGIQIKAPLIVKEDTSSCHELYRGHVLRLGSREFFILGDIYEPRFGLEDQPKYWVKRAFDLDQGVTRILKLVFLEEFETRIGPLTFACRRSPEKEARVLEVTRGHGAFMQGVTIRDVAGNPVRIIDIIPGETLFAHLLELEMSHEEYWFTRFPAILAGLCEALAGLAFLHDHGLCNGDIRNDHIILESGTGRFRWIDFDLDQDTTECDVWRVGNLLQFCAGKGLTTFHETRAARKGDVRALDGLSARDASLLYPYRIMNLRKVHGHIPERLNRILLRFSTEGTSRYENVRQILDDLRESREAEPALR